MQQQIKHQMVVTIFNGNSTFSPTVRSPDPSSLAPAVMHWPLLLVYDVHTQPWSARLTRGGEQHIQWGKPTTLSSAQKATWRGSCPPNFTMRVGRQGLYRNNYWGYTALPQKAPPEPPDQVPLPVYSLSSLPLPRCNHLLVSWLFG